MKKVKWFKLNIWFEFEIVVRCFFFDFFIEDKGKGFIFDKICYDFVSGCFVECIVYYDKILSFDGSEIIVERIEYCIINFSVVVDFFFVM